MVIDLNARTRLLEEKRTKSLMEGFVQALGAKKDENKDGDYKMTVRLKQETDPNVTNLVDNISKGLILLYKAVKNVRIDLPKIYKVSGSVDVDSLPPVKINNLQELGKYFQSMETRIENLTKSIVAVANQPPPTISVPKSAPVDPSLFSPVLKALQRLGDDLKDAAAKPGDSGDIIRSIRHLDETMTAFANQPKLTTAPVTNFNLNGLRGPVLSTAVNVTTTATPLPTHPLANRRSMIVFNNGGSTIYLGSSAVTVSSGLPVLSQTYSPAMDLGILSVLYGIASGTVETRVFEASMDSVGE